MPNLNNRNPLTNWPGQTDSAIDPSTGLPHGTWDKNTLYRNIVNFEERAIPGTILIVLNSDFIADDTIAVAGKTITFYEDVEALGTIAITLDNNFVGGDTIDVAGETITFYTTDADLAAANGGLGDDFGVSLETNTTALLQATAIAAMTFDGFDLSNPDDAEVLFTEEIAGTQTIEEAVVTGTGALLVNIATPNEGANDDYGISLATSTTEILQAVAIASMIFEGFEVINPNDSEILFTEQIAGTQTIEEAVVTGTGTLASNEITEASGYEDPLIFFLLASDVLVLRDAVFSIQETLGVNPGQSSIDPSITNLTERLLYIESGEAFDSRYDERYGGVPQTLTYGATWSAIYLGSPGQRSKITILGHKHDGVLNSKISLSTDITGLLGLSNLDIENITGSNLWSDSSKTQTIATSFINSLSLTSMNQQSVSGPIQVNNNFGSLLIKDLEVKDNILAGYSSSNDTSAWSGSSFIASTATANGIFFRKDLTKTKYWRYSIGLRSSVSDNSITGMIGKIIVKNTTTGATLKSFNIYPTLYNGTTYEIIYTDFIFNGTRPQESIRIELEWVGNGKGVTWKTDSISMVPIHLSVYDI